MESERVEQYAVAPMPTDVQTQSAATAVQPLWSASTFHAQVVHESLLSDVGLRASTAKLVCRIVRIIHRSFLLIPASALIPQYSKPPHSTP
jgi:hypothetical protein